jgi:hypothetical protein
MSDPTRNMKMNGVVAVYSDPELLKKAAAQIRDLKVVKFDTYTPFPVHGIEDAMGIKRSPLPWVTFGAGLTGCLAGLGLQIWVSAVDWPLNVGGKPFVSLPAFIPVTFELTILFAGLATAGALFYFCGLPKIGTPILDPNITNDKFALFVSSDDANYREAEFKELLKKSGAQDVRIV